MRVKINLEIRESLRRPVLSLKLIKGHKVGKILQNIQPQFQRHQRIKASGE